MLRTLVVCTIAAAAAQVQRKGVGGASIHVDTWESALATALPEPVTGPLLLTDGVRRQQIVVVASLLDKAPNLAGLTRTCEVFRAEKLVLADLRVLKDHDFVGISVTAEQHVPLEVDLLVLKGSLSIFRSSTIENYSLARNGVSSRIRKSAAEVYHHPEQIVDSLHALHRE